MYRLANVNMGLALISGWHQRRKNIHKQILQKLFLFLISDKLLTAQSTARFSISTRLHHPHWCVPKGLWMRCTMGALTSYWGADQTLLILPSCYQLGLEVTHRQRHTKAHNQLYMHRSIRTGKGIQDFKRMQMLKLSPLQTIHTLWGVDMQAVKKVTPHMCPQTHRNTLFPFISSRGMFCSVETSVSCLHEFVCVCICACYKNQRAEKDLLKMMGKEWKMRGVVGRCFLNKHS